MPNVTSKFLSYDNEAAKYDLVEFKDQCFKVFCYQAVTFFLHMGVTLGGGACEMT